MSETLTKQRMQQIVVTTTSGRMFVSSTYDAADRDIATTHTQYATVLFLCFKTEEGYDICINFNTIESITYVTLPIH